MTAEVFLDATETAPSVDVSRPAAGGLVVPLPQAAEPTQLQAPPGIAQLLQAQAPWVLGLGAGRRDGDAPAPRRTLVAATTLLLWLAVHLGLRRGHIESRLGPALPRFRDLARHVSVPFAVVGLAVVAGVMDVHALGRSLADRRCRHRRAGGHHPARPYGAPAAARAGSR